MAKSKSVQTPSQKEPIILAAGPGNKQPVITTGLVMPNKKRSNKSWVL
ncbi:hypothetical protein ACFLV7_04080 [Chloroflexota bacterium]